MYACKVDLCGRAEPKKRASNVKGAEKIDGEESCHSVINKQLPSAEQDRFATQPNQAPVFLNLMPLEQTYRSFWSKQCSNDQWSLQNERMNRDYRLFSKDFEPVQF